MSKNLLVECNRGQKGENAMSAEMLKALLNWIEAAQRKGFPVRVILKGIQLLVSDPSTLARIKLLLGQEFELKALLNWIEAAQKRGLLAQAILEKIRPLTFDRKARARIERLLEREPRAGDFFVCCPP